MASRKAMSEKFVKNAIIKWLQKQNYAWALDAKELREHGVDIKVRHKNVKRFYYVETKGDSTPSGMESNFLKALGQIITRMKSKARDHYAIGFPSSYKKIVTKRVPYNACRKLDLKFLFVDEKGNVEKITSVELKKMQKK